MTSFFSREPAVLLLVILLHGTFVAFGTYQVANFLRRRIAGISDYVPVAPYFVSVTTVFSFLLAFHASEVWLRKSNARNDAGQIRLNIERLVNLWGPRELNLPEASTILGEYVSAVVREEWSNGNLKESATAREKWTRLRAVIHAAGAGRDVGRSQLIMAEIEQLRTKKFLIANSGSGVVLLVLGTLGALSHLSIACVHWDRPKSMAVALGIFAFATSLVYFLVAVDEVTYRSADHFGVGTWQSFTPPPASD
jgi:hypothetical protein